MQTDKYSELLNRLENEELEVSVMGQTQCICPDMITHLLSIFFLHRIPPWAPNFISSCWQFTFIKLTC